MRCQKWRDCFTVLALLEGLPDRVSDDGRRPSSEAIEVAVDQLREWKRGKQPMPLEIRADAVTGAIVMDFYGSRLTIERDGEAKVEMEVRA